MTGLQHQSRRFLLRPRLERLLPLLLLLLKLPLDRDEPLLLLRERLSLDLRAGDAAR